MLTANDTLSFTITIAETRTCFYLSKKINYGIRLISKWISEKIYNTFFVIKLCCFKECRRYIYIYIINLPKQIGYNEIELSFNG